MVPLRVPEAKQTFLEKVTAHVSRRPAKAVKGRTPPRSKRQRPRSSACGCRTRLRCRPRPICRPSTARGHEGSLRASVRMLRGRGIGGVFRGPRTVPGVAVGAVVFTDCTEKALADQTTSPTLHRDESHCWEPPGHAPVPHWRSATYGPHFFQYFFLSRSSFSRSSSRVSASSPVSLDDMSFLLSKGPFGREMRSEGSRLGVGRRGVLSAGRIGSGTSSLGETR